MPIGKLTEFNVRTGNWTLYIERAEMFFKVNEVKKDLWLPTLIAAMGDESYELLSNLTSPDLPSSKTYTEVVSVIKNHLQPKPSFISQRYHFRQRRQNAGESISQYLSELKKMAKYCEFKTALEDNLRDQLICGLRSELIRQRLFAEENLVYGKAVTIACAMEAAEKDAAAVEQKTTGGVTDPGGGSETGSAASALNAVNAHSARRSGPGHRGRGGARAPAASSGPDRKGQGDSRYNCYACGAAGHGSDECRYRRFICGRCKQRGHLRRVCPLNNGGPRGLRGGIHSNMVAHVRTSNEASSERMDFPEWSGDDEPPSTSDEEDWRVEELHQLSLSSYKPA
ncbi:uncharacterized protein LOC110999258 [Pieris rapae]|uniref:uncharacterized protein LOC110999258 n=1 Tax=Pieris rapae TaxID=64459 RepID=UPI001E27B8A1|nr:uncharacterized protein LOC110999258 [Pieris rapae]